MKMKILGSGTSHGIPVIACSCKVCTSENPKDNRNRASAFIFEPCNIVIDTGPEFRLQAIKYGIKKLDCVLITHSHADHLHGLDDVRVFSNSQMNQEEHESLKIYTNTKSLKDIEYRFDYVFKEVQEGGGKPKFSLIDDKEFSFENPIILNYLKIIPVPLLHGNLSDTGWLFIDEKSENCSSIAYLTDCSKIPKDSILLLKKSCKQIKHFVVDGLRIKPHVTHFSILEAMELADKIGPKHTWITHINHTLSHKEVQNYIDENLYRFMNLKKIVQEGGSVSPSYDGLILE